MAEFNLIPHPSTLKSKGGYFCLDEDTRLCPDSANQTNAEYLQRLLQPSTGFPLEIDPHPPSKKDTIYLTIRDDLENLGEEGYQLIVTTGGARLQAHTPAGIFYAIQTLRQLLPAEIEAPIPVCGMVWQIPCVEIEDIPRYPWRGYMLDEARHFQGIDTVKKLLDLMALFKLNRFHWHLTDDQGWRIEIRQYPRLTEIGGQRAGTVVGNPYLSQKHNQIPHQGFYTQDQIQEVVAYARERQIMVIPEIEIPGHSTAALAAYPQFSCTGGPFEVITGWGIFPEIYCAGKPETYEFLRNILAEVIELFPAPYIHIGGDEAPKKRWKACPDCQLKITQENLPDEEALQVHMVNQIAEFLRQHEKRMIFWSDSFAPEIDPDAI
ncbi:MAG: beta-N-acetylhexosaminidase, partial [Anaerolineales bacterium]